MTTNSGFFLTIEGIEGSGKSTLSDHVFENYQSNDISVVRTAEPGGDPVAKSIRNLLLNPEYKIAKNTELLLFEASRSQNVENVILPALRQGKMVISDRFSDSTLAYQGYARGFSIDLINKFNDFASQGLIPNLTILLDLPVEVGLARQIGIDRISKENIIFHNKVRQGFLDIAIKNPERIVVIDASMQHDQVLAKTIDAINAMKNRRC